MPEEPPRNVHSSLTLEPASRIVDEAYDKVGITARLGLKDANLVLAAAHTAELPMPSANVWRDRLLGAIAHGDGDKD